MAIKLVIPVNDDCIKKFFNKVKKTNGCWLWNGAKNSYGYGSFWYCERIVKAHRMSWMIHFGKIPKSHSVCHKCDNPLCVNPKHLWVGTHTQNMQDMIKKGRHKSHPGEKNGMSILTENDVIMARKIHKELPNIKAIARIFNVSHPAMFCAIKKRSWKKIAAEGV